jgi:hydroxymethylbilane synthase
MSVTRATGPAGRGLVWTADRPLRVGTRGSLLARTQSGAVADALAVATGARTELVTITTHGDVSEEPLARIGGAGVFVSALRAALLEGTVDVAVHSLKDLPTQVPAGIELAAVPAREDPRDVLVAAAGRGLGDLPDGATIGTGSPRRAAQVRAVARARGQRWTVLDVRGNVDTRLRMVASGRLDAVVLAGAGLARLGRLGEATEILDPQLVMPAPGQGALAVEVRAGDPVAGLVAPLDDTATRFAVTAERAVLAGLEAGCAAPVGAWAVLDVPDDGDAPHDGDGRTAGLTVHAVAATVDGAVVVRRRAHRRVGTLADASRLGADLARDLLSDEAASALPLATGSVAREHP